MSAGREQQLVGRRRPPRAPHHRIVSGDDERGILVLALELAADDAPVVRGDVSDLFGHGGWRDIDGDDLRMRMRQRGTTTDAVVHDHLGVDVAGCGMRSCPVVQRQQHLEDLVVIEPGERTMMVRGQEDDLVRASR